MEIPAPPRVLGLWGLTSSKASCTQGTKSAGRELNCLHINLLAQSHLHKGKGGKKKSKQKEHEKLIGF